MSIWEMITEKSRELPPQVQQEVLDFIEFLQSKQARRPAPELQESPAPREAPLLGMWSDEAETLDEIIEELMEEREHRKLRASDE